MRELIFLAGPYTTPDPVLNTRGTILVMRALLDAGYTPFCPHLCLLAEMVLPAPYNFWTEYGLRVLTSCTALIRLKGASNGADKEVAVALELGIPVYNSLENFIALNPRD